MSWVIVAQWCHIWQHRSGSILTQVRACCPMTSSHYLYPSWLQWGSVVFTGVWFVKWTFIPHFLISPNNFWYWKTRACLGCVILLGQPRLVKELCWMPFLRTLSRNGQMIFNQILKVKVIFNTSCRIPCYIIGAKSGNSSSNPLQVIAGQGKFARILSQNGQNDLEGQKSMSPIFNTSWEYPRMHVWCKFGDSSPNLW